MFYLVKLTPPRPCAKRTRRGRAATWALSIAALAVVAFAASRAAIPVSGLAAPSKDVAIAVVGAGEDDPLWPVIRAVSAARQAQVPQYRIRVEAPPMTSINAQHALLRRLRDEAAAVCVQVIEPAATRPVLEELRRAGLIVVTMGRPVEAEVPFLHVGWSEGLVGEQLARTLVDQLPDGGMIALLTRRSDAGDDDRALAMRSELRRFVGLRIIAEYPCRTSSDAQAAMAAAHENFPALAGWLSLGDWPLHIDAERAEAALGGRMLVAADASPATWPVLERNLPITVITPDYARLAGAAIDRARDVLMGRGDARDRSQLPILAITHANVAGFRSACLPEPAGTPAPGR